MFSTSQKEKCTHLRQQNNVNREKQALVFQIYIFDETVKILRMKS